MWVHALIAASQFLASAQDIDLETRVQGLAWPDFCVAIKAAIPTVTS